MENVKNALIKKATGYFYDEVVSEMAVDVLTNKLVVVKQKVTKKHVPPDVSAAKTLLIEQDKNALDINSLTTEQLQEEKTRLLKLLNEEDLSEEQEE